MEVLTVLGWIGARSVPLLARPVSAFWALRKSRAEIQALFKNQNRKPKLSATELDAKISLNLRMVRKFLNI